MWECHTKECLLLLRESKSAISSTRRCDDALAGCVVDGEIVDDATIDDRFLLVMEGEDTRHTDAVSDGIEDRSARENDFFATVEVGSDSSERAWEIFYLSIADHVFQLGDD